MIEERKVWRRFHGYKRIEASHDNVVVILHTGRDGYRYMDHLIYYRGKWRSAHGIPENKIIGYYEVTDFISCRCRVQDKIESIPDNFIGEALVLWEWNRKYDGSPMDEVIEGVKISSVEKGRVWYAIEHQPGKGPDDIVGYHILPDKFYGKLEDGTDEYFIPSQGWYDKN